MLSIRKSWLLTVLLLGLFVTGCGKNSPLRGKVTFMEDESPLTVGIVYFESGNIMARGELRSDGSYQVGTLNQKDGLPPGEYKVYIGGAHTADTGSGQQRTELDSMGVPMAVAPLLRPLIDRKYATADQTPLVCKVPAPKNRFDIVVEKPK